MTQTSLLNNLSCIVIKFPNKNKEKERKEKVETKDRLFITKIACYYISRMRASILKGLRNDHKRENGNV